jgi:hypothetical protein
VTKIGHTDGFVFSGLLQQYLVTPLWGDELVMSPPHPNAPGTSAVTLSVVPRDDAVAIDPDVRKTLSAMSRMACAVGRGENVHVEKELVDGEDEVKYIITIKKQNNV